uniref:EamA domain-containing protein n=1 Tax=viral metagenome TaxID=1070528 RepID=A0A6C0K759_9ZZZZ
MIGLAEFIVPASEVILASYPILIKSVDTNLWTQVFVRNLVYTSIAAFILGFGKQGFSDVSLMNTSGGGLLNLFHVGVSYKAFSDLPAGNAMAIFYAYPIWNLIGAYFIFNERIPWYQMPWIVLALTGMLMIAQPNVGTLLNAEKPLGLLAAVFSGITESMIYFFFRLLGNKETTFRGMFELYGGSFAWMLPVVGLASLFANANTSLPKLDLSTKSWVPMILFNALVGFIGYSMRFAAIPYVSTMIFSVLSFFGIVAAFVFGYLFEGEKPSVLAAGGSLAILIANIAILSQR